MRLNVRRLRHTAYRLQLSAIFINCTDVVQGGNLSVLGANMNYSMLIGSRSEGDIFDLVQRLA